MGNSPDARSSRSFRFPSNGTDRLEELDGKIAEGSAAEERGKLHDDDTCPGD
jgi:hypothetical protein